MKIRTRKAMRNLGVSTVVANMLMILITMALGSLLITWASTSYGGFTGSSLYFVQRQQALEEQFTIENVFFTKSQGYIDIFVRNVGVTNVVVDAIYVDGIAETPTGTGPNGAVTCTIPIGSPPGLVLGTAAASSGVTACNKTPNAADFTVQLLNGFNSNCPSQPWCSGDVFYIVVASGEGNQAAYNGGAP